MTCRDMFKTRVSYVLGDGKNIKIWSDIWIKETLLSTQFPGLHSRIVNKEATVSTCWNKKGWRWRYIARSLDTPNTSVNRQQMNTLKNLLLQYSPSDTPNVIKWRWTAGQIFTVKSLYRFITDDGQTDSLYAHPWRLRILTKSRIFIWILLRNRVLTKDRLIRRGYAVD